MDHLRRPFRGVRWLPAAALAFLSAANGFPVAAASSLISIAPNSGVQGQTVPSVTITGANTHFTNGSIIDLGAGITASKISAKDATHLAAQLTIAGTAATGSHTLTVTSGMEKVVLNNAFTVNRATSPGSVFYTYDSQGRLATAAYTSSTGTVTVTYTYDTAGNRTSVVTK